MYNITDTDNDAVKLNGHTCFLGEIWITPDNR